MAGQSVDEGTPCPSIKKHDMKGGAVAPHAKPSKHAPVHIMTGENVGDPVVVESVKRRRRHRRLVLGTGRPVTMVAL